MVKNIQNIIQTILLLTAMAALMGAIGWFLAGGLGLGILVSMTLGGLLFSPKLPAHYIMKIYRARPIDPHELPGLYLTLKKLTINAGLNRMPRLYYSSSPILNAFAAGTREDAAICITRGLLNHLNQDQMAGILGHEISHIKNNDTQLMSAAQMFNRSTSFLSSLTLFLFILILPFDLMGMISLSFTALLLILSAPTLSTLLYLGLSRTREFEADLGSAQLLGSPYPLASALHQLEKWQGQNRFPFFRVNPARPPEMLSSHPDTRQRIQRLMALAKQGKKGKIKPGYMASRPMFIPIDFHDIVSRQFRAEQ